MKVSQKTDYALRALFTLVEHYQGKPVPTRTLAEQNDIPKPFLEHILLELKAQGWVESLPGKGGGYRLRQDPAQITMGAVVRLFDGRLAPIGCVSVNNYTPCSQESTCRFRRVFLEIRNWTAQAMDRLSLATVSAGKPVRREEVFADTMYGGLGI